MTEYSHRPRQIVVVCFLAAAVKGQETVISDDVVHHTEEDVLIDTAGTPADVKEPESVSMMNDAYHLQDDRLLTMNPQVPAPNQINAPKFDVPAENYPLPYFRGLATPKAYFDGNQFVCVCV